MIRTLLVVALLSGCAQLCPAPKVVDRPVTVEKLVPVKCAITVGKPSTWATSRIVRHMGIFDQTRLLLEELAERRQYEANLEASIAGCK
jgi:hypothetical protein